MRSPRGLRAGLLLLPLVLALPASADEATVLGGEQLGTRGVVVDAAAPSLPATAAAGWLVADLDTGDVLAARDPHGRFAPASTLKTLTALTLIPKLDPHREVAPSFDAVNVDGSKVGLVQKVKYPISQLFTAMLVVSGNDAANTLAEANGGVATTVEQMNAEALRLQAFDTHAVNANGLDGKGQLSSPYDLALIARAGMQLPAFRSYVATKRSRVRGPGGRAIAISSHDKLLYNYDGAIGIKNGYTVSARATFVGAATRGGRTLVVTLMRTNPRYWPEAAALLDWGFAATARGVTPVGHLVDPVSTDVQGVQGAQQSAPSPAPIRNAAAKLAQRDDGGLPVFPLALTVGGVAVVGAGLTRSRRHRHRRPRMKLPPL